MPDQTEQKEQLQAGGLSPVLVELGGWAHLGNEDTVVRAILLPGILGREVGDEQSCLVPLQFCS